VLWDWFSHFIDLKDVALRTWCKTSPLSSDSPPPKWQNTEQVNQDARLVKSLGKIDMEMTNNPNFTIRSAITLSDLTAIRELFTAYAFSLGIDLSFQNFTAELELLPGLYAPPSGALFLAFTPDGEAIGCVGLRPLPSPHNPSISRDGERNGQGKKICEMKRLYCAPPIRGLGIGRALVEKVIKEAEKLGYAEMRLDTLPSMEGARKLYNQCGFVEIEAYYATPLEETFFLGKKLGAA
jgi:GNAT superfamily N-acetyltransferase